MVIVFLETTRHVTRQDKLSRRPDVTILSVIRLDVMRVRNYVVCADIVRIRFFRRMRVDRVVLPHKVVTRIFNVSGHLLIIGISHMEVHQAATIRGIGGQCAHRDAVKSQGTIFAVDVLSRMQPNTARTVNTDIIQCPHSNGHIFATASNLMVVEFEPVIFIGGIFFRRIVLPRTGVNTDSTFVTFGLKENLVSVRILFSRHRMRDNAASTDTKRGMFVRHTEDCTSFIKLFIIKVIRINTGILFDTVVHVVFVILTVFLI